MLRWRFRRPCRFRCCDSFRSTGEPCLLSSRLPAEGNRLLVVGDEAVPCAASSIETGASWLPTKRKAMRQSPFMVHPRYLDFTLANRRSQRRENLPRPIRSSIIFTFTLPDHHILNSGFHVYWRRKPTRRVRFRRITLSRTIKTHIKVRPGSFAIGGTCFLQL